ncbi:GNAT family protein [Nocardioides nanhaiensis]|uniref:GNAT family protein n=1 Tax=Nocardioides nanhaiensis TaxID=1476871 RepID=A0ABP8VYF0_9ACTN
MTARHLPPPPLPLTTERLMLRPLTPADADDVQRYWGDPEVARYLPFGPLDAEATRAKVERLAANTDPQRTDEVLSLAMVHAGRVEGDLMLRLGRGPDDGPPSVAEVGWVTHPEVRGIGLAAEGAGAVVDLAFGHYRCHRVTAVLDPRNTASARLCERLGMRLEGVTRRDHWARGEWSDTAVYGLLREEWADLS